MNRSRVPLGLDVLDIGTIMTGCVIASFLSGILYQVGDYNLSCSQNNFRYTDRPLNCYVASSDQQARYILIT